MAKAGGGAGGSLSAEQKLQVWLKLLAGQTTQREAAERLGRRSDDDHDSRALPGREP